jgi:thioredoxin-like negative regulator of GroEL
MPLLALDEISFHGVLSEDGVAAIQCWAPWCGGCENLERDLAAVQERFPEVVFARLDTGAHPDLARSLGVTQVPSLLIFRDGVLLLRQPGRWSPSELEDLLLQASSLDMDVVRAELSRETREAELAVSF